jgi:hypothetical protein
MQLLNEQAVSGSKTIKAAAKPIKRRMDRPPLLARGFRRWLRLVIRRPGQPFSHRVAPRQDLHLVRPDQVDTLQAAQHTDTGLTALGIAQQPDEHVGNVELILALREPTPQS